MKEILCEDYVIGDFIVALENLKLKPVKNALFRRHTPWTLNLPPGPPVITINQEAREAINGVLDSKDMKAWEYFKAFSACLHKLGLGPDSDSYIRYKNLVLIRHHNFLANRHDK